VIKLDDSRLSDAVTERVCRSIRDAVHEIQDLPAMKLRLIRDVVVVNNNDVIVRHGLGRAPLWVGISAVRWDGAAFIDSGTFFDRGTRDAAGNPIERSKFIVLAADNFTSAGSVVLTVDVLVL
jgi:hypothetical protein